jgi:hypothetical protein
MESLISHHNNNDGYKIYTVDMTDFKEQAIMFISKKMITKQQIAAHWIDKPNAFTGYPFISFLPKKD